MTAAETVGIALLTLRVALVATVFAGIPALAIGYALARFRFPGKPLVQTIVALPMVLPPVAIGLALLEILSIKSPIGRACEALFGQTLILTWWAAALASSVVAFPLIARAAEQAFAAVPVRLENVARTLGCSRPGVFRRVTLPLAARGLLYGGLFGFARALGEFGATAMVAGRIPGETETLALAIYGRIEMFREGEAWILAGVSLLLALVPTAAAEVFLRRGER
ncbi:MAG: molybdate transport system permease [Planctomycetota bacterium]|nr:MAG: molybdate transport system permease [Planctomycetota bacterium]